MTAPSKAGLPPIAQAIIAAVESAATIARLLGDLETARRVEDVLGDRFPGFRRRAEDAADTVSRRMGQSA